MLPVYTPRGPHRSARPRARALLARPSRRH